MATRPGGRADADQEGPWPGFFIVGAPRSGTTALATYLDAHPDVFCLASGPHYYERDQEPDVETTVHDEDAYRRLFEGAGRAERVGEKSVWYLRDPWAPKAIREDVPEADVLILLRDPVEMVASLHARRLERGDETIPDLGEALEAEADRRRGDRIPDSVPAPKTLHYTEVASYPTQVRRWLDVFGEDQVKVLLHDDLEEDPAGTYGEALDFLGVDDDFRPSFERVRPRRRVRSHRLHRWLWDPPAPVSAAADLVPTGLREATVDRLRSWNLDGTGDRSVDPEVRAELEATFRDDVRELEVLLDRDLSGWLD